jgi:hypothetical protein
MHTRLDIEPIHICFQWIIFLCSCLLSTLLTIMNAISPLAVYESSDSLSVFGMLILSGSYLDDQVGN